jgi:hypothetical protein
MLRRMSVLLLGLLSACDVSLRRANYCESGDSSRLTIDFANEEIYFTSLGTSDQQSAINRCSDQIESCFLGEMSFVNPYEAPISLNRNVVSAHRMRDGFVITTRGGGTLSSYYIERGNKLPTEFRISGLNGENPLVYTRCRGLRSILVR